MRERERRAAACSLTLLDLADSNDSDSTWFTFVSHPQLAARIAADAVGLVHQSREHFDAAHEAALDQSR